MKKEKARPASAQWPSSRNDVMAPAANLCLAQRRHRDRRAVRDRGRVALAGDAVDDAHALRKRPASPRRTRWRPAARGLRCGWTLAARSCRGRRVGEAIAALAGDASAVAHGTGGRLIVSTLARSERSASSASTSMVSSTGIAVSAVAPSRSRLRPESEAASRSSDICAPHAQLAARAHGVRDAENDGRVAQGATRRTRARSRARDRQQNRGRSRGRPRDGTAPGRRRAPAPGRHVRRTASPAPRPE